MSLMSAGPGWTLLVPSEVARKRRGAIPSATTSDPFLARLDARLVEVVEEAVASPAAVTRRGVAAATAAPLRVSVPADADGALCLMLRRPSGAISFHPVPARARGAARSARSVALPAVASGEGQASGRRGVVGVAVRVVLLRLLTPLLRASLPKLAQRWEAAQWKERGLHRGWVRIDSGAAGELTLTPAVPSAQEARDGRVLLLLHGTFSDTRGSFGALAANGFLARARSVYGERVFGFEHFSVSQSLDENLDALWEELPAAEIELDLVGYSRGCLLARRLLERAMGGRERHRRVRIGRIVLVAGPNLGTPLADPARHADTIGWFANLIDALPDTPFTTVAAWIAHALSWLAQGVVGSLPGLAAMNPSGASVRGLRGLASRDAARCAAVVAEHTAVGGLALRFADLGIDAFFRGANDLVVPTEGGWQLDGAQGAHIAPDRVLAFGRGAPSAVHHCNVLGEAATGEFIAHQLGLPGPRRGTLEPASPRAQAADAGADDGGRDATRMTLEVPEAAADETFHILVLGEPGRSSPRPSVVVASYRGARVVDRYHWGRNQAEHFDGGEAGGGAGSAVAAGKRWQRIIALTSILHDYFAGKPGVTPLAPAQLEELGRALFEALFSGAVGRLYDEARGGQGARRLHLVLSSNIALWAEKPWEFALDPHRGTWLATQDIHLLRDVLGPIPTDRLVPHRAPLRLLLVHAQPIDAGALSVEEEARLITRGFRALADAGLVQIEALPRATPATLHARMSRPGPAFDIVHFIGHGVYDTAAGAGFLVFEDAHGRSQRVHENEVGDILCGRGLRLVFLNACETGRGGGRAEFLRGLAPTLLRRGVPAVIANQFAVDDGAAVTFAQALYARLAQGVSVAEAVRESRIAVNYSLAGVGIDWAVPVLFTRVPALRIVETPAPVPDAALWERALQDAMMRSDAAPRQEVGWRVGLWDAARRLPALRDLVDRMNAAQARVHFTVEEVAAPLDARRVRRMPDGTHQSYLDADVLRARLRGLPLQRGLDLLVGISARPMVAQGIWDAFGCWGADASGMESTVAMLSTHGFDVRPDSPDADHLLLNTVVGVLAGQFGQLMAHRGSKLCPLYFNPSRRLALLIARRRFAPSVRAALRRRVPDLLPALDALLALVPATKRAGASPRQRRQR